MKNQTRKKTTKNRITIKLGLIASGVIVLIAAFVLGLYFTSKSLFSGNKHFILHNVVVKYGGWWKDHPEKVNSILGLKENETNLFEINLKKKREILESQPSIEKATISRVLPDIIEIGIVERIPVAFLHFVHNKLLVDQSAKVMDAESCIEVGDSLPVITGFTSQEGDLTPGNQLNQIKPALSLMKMMKRSVANIVILRINISNSDFYRCDIYVPKFKKKYLLYLSHERVENKLYVLNTLLNEDSLPKPGAKIIDLRNDGQAVLK